MIEKKKKSHYVDDEKFYQEIVKYKELCLEHVREGKEKPKLSNYIGECIYKIAEKLSTIGKFRNYSFREEMVGDGIENCFLYFDDFDHTKYKKPFAYFTQVIYYAFLRRILKEEKDRYTKYKFFQETITHTEGADRLVDSDGNNLAPSQMYDNLNTFMAKFEAREEAKKQKRKEVKGLQKFYGENNARTTKKPTITDHILNQ